MLTEDQYRVVMARIAALMNEKGLAHLEGEELYRLACEAEEYEKATCPFPHEATK